MIETNNHAKNCQNLGIIYWVYSRLSEFSMLISLCNVSYSVVLEFAEILNRATLYKKSLPNYRTITNSSDIAKGQKIRA